MIKKIEESIDDYLSTNSVTNQLDSSERELLKKFLYDFAHYSKSADCIETLLKFAKNTLTDKRRFSSDLAKISNEALAMILNLK
ncbi:hypothetical protein ACFSQ3_09415 [Sphingobacterium corticis]|uniref:Bacteriocin immunity protein n=1 Tax=Sphingobacterium corticis TaxID=1812823 RepID=A0ABW5NJF1_9SPHI